MNRTILILENDSITAMAIARLVVNKNNRVIVKKSLLDAKDFIVTNFIDCIVACENVIFEISTSQEIECTLINRGVPIVYLHSGRKSRISSYLNIVASVSKPFNPEQIYSFLKKFHLGNIN